MRRTYHWFHSCYKLVICLDITTLHKAWKKDPSCREISTCNSMCNSIYLSTYLPTYLSIYLSLSQIKSPTKSLLQHTLGLQTSAQNVNKKTVLRANGRCKAAKKEFTRVPAGSYKFISLVQARQIGSANDEIFFPQAQITAIWSGIKRRGCFKIFQVNLNPILASFKCQMCLLSSVLSLLFGLWKKTYGSSIWS